MKIIDHIRKLIRKNSSLRKFFAYYVVTSGLFDRLILTKSLSQAWQLRLKETLKCPDNELIYRVDNAGQIINGKQIMHNGLKIHLGSYYGPEVARILYDNRGVHEPQEEYIFQEVLKSIPEDSVMIELGSFWGFYSMWFNKVIPGAKNILVEPDDFNLGCGTRNFKLNHLKGNFIHAFVGSESDNSMPIKTVCVDELIKNYQIPFVSILHSDIQGFEYEMLKGSVNSIKSGKIGFLFISTHSNDLHYKCLDFLKEHNLPIIVECDKTDTFSEDGLLVAHSSYTNWNRKLKISLKSEF